MAMRAAAQDCDSKSEAINSLTDTINTCKKSLECEQATSTDLQNHLDSARSELCNVTKKLEAAEQDQVCICASDHKV
jgi:chromosome segregation ATPase